MTFEISRAVRVNTPAFIALAGPSGSGKTRSGLELALGLAGDGKVLLADTEGNRALHYADLYEFDHIAFAPPYTPERCGELIDLAEKNGYAVLIVDSGSDEFEGEGGLQEIRDATKDEFWAKTKARHKHALINRVRRARVHVIFCLRCEERVRISKVDGRAVVEQLGWQPICEKRFLYEMQSSFRFDPDRPGVPLPIKLYDIHAKFFPPDRMITREAGRRLAEWAAGGAVAADLDAFAAEAPKLDPTFLALAERVADKGLDAFRDWWKTLSKGNRDVLRDHLGALQARAEDADEDAFTLVSEPDGEPESDAEGQSPPIGKEQNTHGLGGPIPDGAPPQMSLEVPLVKQPGQPADAEETRARMCAMIFERVHTRADIVEFRRVNKTWLAALAGADEVAATQVESALMERERGE